MDGFMGAGVHAFGAKKPAAKTSPKVKGVAKKVSPKKAAAAAAKVSPVAKKSNACACSCKC